jgi:hypothetical protein
LSAYGGASADEPEVADALVRINAFHDERAGGSRASGICTA